MELQASLANLTQQKLGLAAISYDSPAILKSFAERTNITFPLLSDPDSRIIRAWGILNETVPAASPFYGIPYPGVFILDPSGVVVAKYFEDDYRERYTASEILMLPQMADHVSNQPTAPSQRTPYGIAAVSAITFDFARTSCHS